MSGEVSKCLEFHLRLLKATTPAWYTKMQSSQSFSLQLEAGFYLSRAKDTWGCALALQTSKISSDSSSQASSLASLS